MAPRNEPLETYFASCWELYWSVAEEHGEVSGHCPIAYFGDFAAFLDSSPRVLTVGLNPSHREFGDKKGERFPDTVHVDRSLSTDPTWLNSVYARDLDSYFYSGRNPYRGWFDPSFMAVLQGLEVSFYPGDSQVYGQALHSDLYSPIATNPTWSRLPPVGALRARLFDAGPQLWNLFVEILQPDIIVASMQRNGVQQLGLNIIGATTMLTSVTEKKGRTCASVQPFSLKTGKQGLLMTGGAGRKPMNAFRPEDRVRIGKEVRLRWLQTTG